MRIGLGIRVVLSIAIAATLSVIAYTTFTPRGVPVKGQQVNDYITIIHAYPGIPLPQGLRRSTRPETTSAIRSVT